jgi:hypothetical protein
MFSALHNAIPRIEYSRYAETLNRKELIQEDSENYFSEYQK